jgi:hypothetical protein
MTGKAVRVYLRQGQAEAWLTVHTGGETEIAICKVGCYRFIDILAGGRLSGKQRAVSLILLKKIGQIIIDLAETRDLWYEATDSRRERIYRLALKKAGLEVVTKSGVTTIKKRRDK